MKYKKTIDGYGRVHMPKEYRRRLSLREDDAVIVSLDGSRIIVEKAATARELPPENTDIEKIKATIIASLPKSKVYQLAAELLIVLEG